MSIPRLAPSANSLDVTVTVNEKLRPYFTQWFQATKNDGETPEQFTMRVLKGQALNFYKSQNPVDYQERVDAASQTIGEEIQGDLALFDTEVD